MTQSTPWRRLDVPGGRPDPDQRPRVLVFTEGYDFAGEQYFDVASDTLDPNHYECPEDQPEVCRYASHWAPRPFD